ncbi:MAG: bifunctional alpha,alpha-trehalose-phosphate synthase (UDP-forming)/trehalose-phosphatase, partial [Anaerolineae bacterium]|nr:bifunctional alpha,alpha-trehalose-phosphate synthase (UDP-forming)/trehalose-phosphatase [Anaerolineae bacterium]
LMLLPAMVREIAPDPSIGFFLHIPFPSYELFRTLPWREEILSGMLGADLIGFHSFSYARHFNSALLRILGLENEFGRVAVDERPVKVDTFPLGVNVNRFGSAHELPEVQQRIEDLMEQKGDRKIVLSVDRLDFT